MARKRLGQLLMERGLIDADQLNSALAYHRQWGMRLGAALVARGFIAEGTLTRVLSESLQIPMVDLAKVDVDSKALALLKASTCEQNQIFPIAIKSHKGRHTLLLAMADPLNVAAIDEVAFTTDMTVRPAIAQISSIDAAIKKHYFGDKSMDIPPLDFTKRREGKEIQHEDEGEMTIITGADVRVVQLAAQELTAPLDDGDEEEVDLDVELDALRTDADEPDDPVLRAEEAMRKEREEARRLGVPSYMLPPPGDPDPFEDAPTGTFVMAPPPLAPPAVSAPTTSSGLNARTPAERTFADDLLLAPHSERDSVEALEKKFWALMRVLSRRGLVTKDEFLEELARSE